MVPLDVVRDSGMVGVMEMTTGLVPGKNVRPSVLEEKLMVSYILLNL
jgi:hypothetical protein